MPYKYTCLFIIMLGSLFLNAQQLDHLLGDLIIQLSPKLENPEALLHQYRKIKGKPAHWKIKKCLQKDLNIWLVQFDYTTINEYDLLQLLRRQPLIQQAQFNHLLERRKRPDDPFFGQQWNWVNTGANNGIEDADIDADEAWDITTGGLTPEGDTIVIAVLDDGIDLDHRDLQQNLWKNHGEIPNNGIDDDQNGYIDDFNGWNVNTRSDRVDHSQVLNSFGHGTEVSSFIGAVGNNTLLVTGLNWNIKLMIVAPYGVGTDNEASAIEGYEYVLNMRRRYNETNGKEGAFVVASNSSWGSPEAFPEDAPIWCAFYDLLGEAGIVNTVATVNQNTNIDEEGDLPTTCTSPYLIGVSNSNRRDRKVSFAGYGRQSIDLFAPGEQVPILTWPTPNRPTDYKLIGNGTSYSAPTVAGVIGLLYAAPCNNLTAIAKQNPLVAADLVRKYILEGVDIQESMIPLSVTGGRLNAHNSLRQLLEDCNACSSLFGVSFDKQTVESELVFNWVADTTSLARIRYRPIGTTAWAMVDGVKSPYTVQELQACTNYEFELALRCDDELLPYNGPFNRMTDGCCAAPTTIESVAISDTSLELEWATILSSTNYEVRWGITATNDNNTLTTTNATINLSGLLPCTTYDVQVRPNCPSKETEFSSTFQFTTTGCGACIDSTYCASFALDASEEWIEQFVLNDLSYISGNDNGYGDHRGNVASLQTFTTYPISIIPGFSEQRFTEHYKVWIDFNHDGIFDDITETAVASSEAQSENFEDIIRIPGDAILGLTRLRIAMVASTDAVGRMPCATYKFGEVEDYCVNISDGTFQCQPPQGIQVLETGQATVQLDWTTGTMIDQYTVRYRPINTSAWEQQTFTNLDAYIIENLIPCLEYEYQVRSNCSTGVQSDWSATKIFETTCDCSAPTNVQFMPTNEGFNVTWDALPSAFVYRVFYAKTDGTTVREVAVETNSILIQDFTDCTDLNIAITPICLGNMGAATEFPSVNTCIVSSVTLPDLINSLAIYPNPIHTDVMIDISLKRNNPISVSMWNLAGQLVLPPAFTKSLTLDFTVPLKTAHLERGIYFIKIQTEEGIAVRKVLKI